MTDGMPLEDALRSAYAPELGCPPPEAFLSWEMEKLTPEERRRLEEHVERCPACAAERDLARLFEASPEEMEARREDVGFVVSRLRQVRAQVLPFASGPMQERPVAAAERRARRRPVLRPAWGLAAAAALAVTVGVLLQRDSAPPLPDLGPGEVLRGAELAPVAPVGELSELPSELRWEEIPGASGYRWRLTSVDGTVVWEETASGSPTRLPEGLADSLEPAVVYTWTVEALDARGARLASSEPARFRVRPPREEDPPPSPKGEGGKPRGTTP